MPPKKKKVVVADLPPFEQVFALLKERGDADVEDKVIALMDANPDIPINQLTKVSTSKQTIFKYALMHPNVTTRLLKYLIAKGADVNLPGPEVDASPLETAISYALQKPGLFNAGEGDENRVTFLAANGAKIESLSVVCPLFFESNLPNPRVLSIVKRLHVHIPDLATKKIYNKYHPADDNRFLQEATSGGRGFQVAQFLIENGADPTVKTTAGRTLIHIITPTATPEQIQYLVDKGVDPNAKTNSGSTALHYVLVATYSIKDSTSTIVQKLIDLGLDINEKDNAGNTILTAFTPQLLYENFPNSDPTRKAEQVKYLNFLKFLLEAGASVDDTINIPATADPMIRRYNNSLVSMALIDKLGVPPQGNDAALYEEVITKIIDNVVNPNKPDQSQYTLLVYLFSSNFRYGEAFVKSLFDKLVAKGLEINRNIGRYNYLAYVLKPYYMDMLLEAGIDVNGGENPLLFRYYTHGTMPLLERLLDHPDFDYHKLFDGKRADTIVFEYATAQAAHGFVQPELKLRLIREKFAEHAGPAKVPGSGIWEGWSSADAEKLDTVFDAEAGSEVSLCPICLKTASRSEGCVYIQGHNCAKLPGFYHRRLYDLYKNEAGIVTWCTICNRIAKGHRHYNLGYSGGDVPQLLIGRDPFTRDCAATEGGGGLKEKFLRFRRLREHARDLQAQKGKITEREALEELVEEMWNAPLQRKIGTNKLYAEKRFNFPSSNFPAPAPAAAAAVNKPINYNALPDVPNRNAARPPTTFAGKDAVMLTQEPVVIQFHHTQPGGVIYDHVDKYISPETLESFIENQVKNFKTDEFGYCWAYPGDCKGRLHPAEVKPFIPETLYKEYKGKFNWAFGKGGPKQGRGGGRARHTRKMRATSRRRRQTAGAPRNIFVPATNAQCNLPRNRRTNRRNNNTRKNNH